MQVAHMFTGPRASAYKPAQIPRLEAGTHGVEVVGTSFLDDDVHALRTGDPVGERQAEQSGMLLMMCGMCSLERGPATGEPRWCAPDGTEPGERTVRDTVAGVQVGCFRDVYTALVGNAPDQVISR